MRADAVAVKELKQYLTFVVAGEEYAIPILRVREILAYVALTRVPRAPEFIAGVMNLRGRVVPVVDLRMKLGLEPTAITAHTCIVIVEVDNEQAATTLALLAEDVKDVIDLTDEEVEPPPAFGTRIDSSFLIGMADLGDRFALILDADRVLTTLELIAAAQGVAEVAATPPTTPAEGKKKSKRRKEPK